MDEISTYFLLTVSLTFQTLVSMSSSSDSLIFCSLRVWFSSSQSTESDKSHPYNSILQLPVSSVRTFFLIIIICLALLALMLRVPSVPSNISVSLARLKL